MQSEKIQKVLARAGFGSRRELESWITAGRIKVNGLVAHLGERVSEKDKITVDGKKLTPHNNQQGHSLLLYNKPIGEICTRNDPDGRPTVFDHLPRLQHARWVAVGRLDINTSGLLLFTTDGELANKLMHPSTQVQREYAVRVLGEVTDDQLRMLVRGVELEDGMARFEGLVDGGGEGANHWYHVTIAEGKNREVRRLWEAVGVKVSRLKRVRYGSISIPSHVRMGTYTELGFGDAKGLYQIAKLPYQKPVKPLEQRGAYFATRGASKFRVKPRHTGGETPYTPARNSTGKHRGSSSSAWVEASLHNKQRSSE
jgi:23S rRNA pseudouridine2605 synthase